MDKKERREMNMRMIWRIHGDVADQEYTLPGMVYYSVYRCADPLDWRSYLPYRE